VCAESMYDASFDKMHLYVDECDEHYDIELFNDETEGDY
jgi:hypothetical protein